KRYVRLEFRNERVHRSAEIRDYFLLFWGRCAEVHIILMRAEVTLLHQFGNRHLGVNRSAEFLITLPLEWRNVIRRSSSERDYRWLFQLIRESGESPPPLRPKMVRFVENQRLKICLCEKSGDWHANLGSVIGVFAVRVILEMVFVSAVF